MDKILKKLNKLSLQVTLVIASIILGGFYFGSQVNKQRSIERQQQIKIETEKKEQLNKELKDGEQQLIINVINYADTPEGKEMQKQIEKEKYGELYIDEAKADKKGII